MPTVSAPVSEPESSPLPQPLIAKAAVPISTSRRRGLIIVMTSKRGGAPRMRARYLHCQKCPRNWITFALALVFALP